MTLAQRPPVEGPKTVPVELNMQEAAAYFVDLTQHVTNKYISYVQGIYIDNRLNDLELSILVNGSNQFIYAPPNTQGWYVALSTNPPTFKVWQEETNDAIVRLQFVNFPVTPYVWEFVVAEVV